MVYDVIYNVIHNLYNLFFVVKITNCEKINKPPCQQEGEMWSLNLKKYDATTYFLKNKKLEIFAGIQTVMLEKTL